jgi:hypothetical protein
MELTFTIDECECEACAGPSEPFKVSALQDRIVNGTMATWTNHRFVILKTGTDEVVATYPWTPINTWRRNPETKESEAIGFDLNVIPEDRQVEIARTKAYERYDRLLEESGWVAKPPVPHTYVMPGRFDVCDVCDGKGYHVNPSIDASGLSAEDFEEDDRFMADYWGEDDEEEEEEAEEPVGVVTRGAEPSKVRTRGLYDVDCYQCKGQRVMLVVNRSRCDPKVLELLDQVVQDDLDTWAEHEAERRMGA